MKNIYKIFGIVALGILSLTSCNEDFLDVAQYDKVDLKSEFLNEQSALEGLTGVYDLMNPNDAPANEWGFKPNMFSGTHPTMDTQATGWDAVFNDQTWDAGNEDLSKGWSHAYVAIARANTYLVGLEKAPKAGEIVGTDGKVSVVPGTGITDELRFKARAEARALRGFFYTYLAQTFGRVPMLDIKDDFNEKRTKERAATYSEMWDFIIRDFEWAAVRFPLS